MPMKFAFLGAWHSHTSLSFREAVDRPDEFTLVGMYDPDPDVIARNYARWAAELGDIRVFPTVEDVLGSDAIAVVVDGRIAENLGYARRALDAGKHVLMEKPAGTDLDDLISVGELAQSKALCFQVAYMWRYNTAVHRIIELARDGSLGDIFSYRAHIPKPMSWYPELADDVGRYRGDVYFEMAGHLVDIMVILMGEPNRVYPFLGRHHDPEKRWVDNAVVVHEFDKALGTIETAAMHVNAADPRRIEVYGTRATAVHTPIGSINLTLHLSEPASGLAAGTHDLDVDIPPAFPSLLRELSACISGHKEPEYSLDHDVAVQRTLMLGSGITDGRALKAAGA